VAEGEGLYRMNGPRYVAMSVAVAEPRMIQSVSISEISIRTSVEIYLLCRGLFFRQAKMRRRLSACEEAVAGTSASDMRGREQHGRSRLSLRSSGPCS
jgi:hypothetical protein